MGNWIYLTLFCYSFHYFSLIMSFKICIGILAFEQKQFVYWVSVISFISLPLGFAFDQLEGTKCLLRVISFTPILYHVIEKCVKLLPSLLDVHFFALSSTLYCVTFLQDISFLSSNLASLQAKDFAAIKELDHINQEIEKLGRYFAFSIFCRISHPFMCEWHYC